MREPAYKAYPLGSSERGIYDHGFDDGLRDGLRRRRYVVAPEGASPHLDGVWASFDKAIEISEGMVDDGRTPKVGGLLLACLQVVAWELRTAREERKGS